MAAQPNTAATPGGPRSLKLTKPIITHGGPTHELKFKSITAGVMMKHKEMPFRITVGADGSMTPITNYALLADWVADLTGVDHLLLEQMLPSDFAKCMAIVREMVEDVGNS